MEPHQQQVQQGNEEGSKNVNSSGNFLCRQSSTRWTPTTDQIRILKDLYYNNGVRSPTAEQIQRISAKLRQYGKIEGKNVFYWFQNHKARERQKKRFTTPVDHHHHVNVIPLHNNNNNNIRSGGVWKNDDVSTTVYNSSNKFPNIISPGGFPSSSACASPAGFVPVGNYGYGSVAMEKSFRECSITQSGGAAATNYSSGGSMGHKFAWIGTVDHQQYNHHHHPYTSSTYPFLESTRKYAADQQTLELNEDEEDDQETPEIETLPLFPIHGGGDSNMKQDRARDRYCNVLHRRADDCYINVSSGANRASLELTLNTYASIYPNSP